MFELWREKPRCEKSSVSSQECRCTTCDSWDLPMCTPSVELSWRERPYGKIVFQVLQIFCLVWVLSLFVRKKQLIWLFFILSPISWQALTVQSPRNWKGLEFLVQQQQQWAGAGRHQLSNFHCQETWFRPQWPSQGCSAANSSWGDILCKYIYNWQQDAKTHSQEWQTGLEMQWTVNY